MGSSRRDVPSRSNSAQYRELLVPLPQMRSAYLQSDILLQQQQQQQQEAGLRSSFLTLTSVPTMLYIPPPTEAPVEQQRPKPSPLLLLPTEIRLQIYSLLVLPRRLTDLRPAQSKLQASAADSFDYERKEHGTQRPIRGGLEHPTLCIRTIDGEAFANLYAQALPRNSTGQPGTTCARTQYAVRGGRYRTRCMNTTYHCVNVPRIEENIGISRTCKQIHSEVADLLYSSYTFDFDTHIEAIRPFLRDLTPFARRCIKSIRVVKRGLAYDKEFDRAEWTSALRYLTSPDSDLNLRRLELGVVAGMPASGWDRIAAYAPQDFNLLKDTDYMQWLQYLLEFQGLRELDVKAVVEQCAPAETSMAMANFVRFSASIEKGFESFLRGCLITV